MAKSNYELIKDLVIRYKGYFHPKIVYQLILIMIATLELERRNDRTYWYERGMLDYIVKGKDEERRVLYEDAEQMPADNPKKCDWLLRYVGAGIEDAITHIGIVDENIDKNATIVFESLVNMCRHREKGIISDVIDNMRRTLQVLLEDDEKFNINAFIDEVIVALMEEDEVDSTPLSICHLISELSQSEGIGTYADYGCGMSNIVTNLLEDNKYLNLKYYGSDINIINTLISNIRLYFKKQCQYNITTEDILNLDSEESKAFDFITCDLPQDNYVGKAFKYNSRFIYGSPKVGSADWAFIQMVLYELGAKGKAMIIANKGVLTRKSELDIRARIIEADLIEAVITLPMNLYKPNSRYTELIIFNNNKPKERANKILCINASRHYEIVDNRKYVLTSEGIEKIRESYLTGSEELRFSKFITKSKIMERGYSLNLAEYLEYMIIGGKLKESISLCEIADIQGGAPLSAKDIKKLSENPTHYVINIKDLEDGTIIYDDESRINYSYYNYKYNCSIRPFDILMTIRGHRIKLAIVGEECKPAIISQNLVIIRVNQNCYDPYVLYEFLQTNIGMQMLEGLQNGTTTKVITLGKLRGLTVPYFDQQHMKSMGQRIYENKKKYEETIRRAKEEFEETRQNVVEEIKQFIYED